MYLISTALEAALGLGGRFRFQILFQTHVLKRKEAESSCGDWGPLRFWGLGALRPSVQPGSWPLCPRPGPCSWILGLVLLATLTTLIARSCSHGPAAQALLLNIHRTPQHAHSTPCRPWGCLGSQKMREGGGGGGGRGADGGPPLPPLPRGEPHLYLYLGGSREGGDHSLPCPEIKPFSLRSVPGPGRLD